MATLRATAMRRATDLTKIQQGRREVYARGAHFKRSCANRSEARHASNDDATGSCPDSEVRNRLGRPRTNFGIDEDTSKCRFLVCFSDLKFASEFDPEAGELQIQHTSGDCPNDGEMMVWASGGGGMASASELDVGLERDVFLRTLLRELSGTLQDVVGLEEAAGYISVVGGAVGKKLNETYRSALQVDQLTRKQVAEVLVDLKQRIQGDFYVVEEREDRIVLASRSCPFGEFVQGRPVLCMMTSNVFGSIAAENLGYARVELNDTIAMGAPGCRVTVFLTPAADPEGGREYFKRIELEGS